MLLAGILPACSSRIIVSICPEALMQIKGICFFGCISTSDIHSLSVLSSFPVDPFLNQSMNHCRIYIYDISRSFCIKNFHLIQEK